MRNKTWSAVAVLLFLAAFIPLRGGSGKSPSESTNNRFPKPETRQEQYCLRLCLPENEVLFLYDRGEDGGALRLRAEGRAAVESSAAG